MSDRTYTAEEMRLNQAATLREVVVQLDYDISCYDENEGAQRIALQIFRDKVRALISPSAQSALAERIKQECLDYREDLHDQMGWMSPEDIEKFVAKKVQQAVREEAEWWANDAMSETVAGIARLAAHRAACGMPFTADAKGQSRKE